MSREYNGKLEGLNFIKSGKVRDIYDAGENLVFVASDRISAFDVIMNEPIQGKGEILATISTFWFNNTKSIIQNHLISDQVSDYPEEFHQYSDVLSGRSMLVKKCKVLPVECIVRGYVAGSGWKEYQKSQTICGIKLPAGLQEFEKLPEPIFTPSTKADEGHDENISFEQMCEILGEKLANEVKEMAIAVYKFGAEYLEKNGLILADTKFEFGKNENDELILIDEVMTPDSSRFWLKSEYAPGKLQYNFDKQVLRDYLESIDWNKQPPPPVLPKEIIEKTLDKYKEALNLIVR
jgi:phosphoribosylaminoimidazole-succinocarboxamide synthase